MAQNTKTPVMVLQELTVKKNFAPPDYQIIFQISGTHENRFDFAVSVAGIQAQGSGSSKQIGKHQAAHNALMKLQEMGIYNPSDNPVSEFKVPLRDENSPYKSALNCIVDLQNLCLENKIPAPEFIEVSGIGPPHAKEFTYECKISSITTEAKANTKKMAKQLAAKVMLERIKDMIPDLVTEENERCNKLTERDAEAISRFNDLHEVVIPDKSVKIDEIPNTLAKLMKLNNLTFEDFKMDLKAGTEESLERILTKLEVSYEILPFQAKPPMAVLTLRTDTPFVTMGMGSSYEEAKQEALHQAFTMMKCYMKIMLPN